MNSILPGMAPAAWGAALLVVSAFFLWRKVFRRAAPIMAFTGVCLLGGGLLSNLIQMAVRTVTGLTNSVTGKVFGVAVPGLIALLLLLDLVNDLHNRGSGRAGKKTYFVAVALAAVLVAGASSIPVLNQVPHGVRTSVTSITTGG